MKLTYAILQKGITLFCMILCLPLGAQDNYVQSESVSGGFPLFASGTAASLYVHDADHAGVLLAAEAWVQDLYQVTGMRPSLTTGTTPTGKYIVVAGTIGKSPWIDDLVQRGKLDVTGIAGQWESFVVQVIEKPFHGVDQALVIAGSDKRGTIFGIYDLSKQMGVSPWYWWADVPIVKRTALYITPGRHIQGPPAVQYRGIFLNDEEPALGRWAVEKYGGFTHAFYERLFELILRMKGNYLWPAMWWASFNSDDPLNPTLADRYGIVMGTTHHEPMMRAHAEWRKGGQGPWNYETNAPTLRQFWTDGITRMGARESIVSMGMRGDGDMAMSASTNIALLEKIVRDQRHIIQSVTGKDAAQTPQLWALYKEVQDYYDKGMRVPDDITLLLCDDNWGNLRKLPPVGDSLRAGGYGIYYHFDYVGGPRNYKWLNTNQLERTWEQMHLAYRFGATKLWIVNVGDLKPMELPTEFFLDYAWNPEAWNNTTLGDYTRQWAARQFGSTYAAEIASLLDTYTKYNARRKPELLSPETYSLVNYREAERIEADYSALTQRAKALAGQLPAMHQDAYYQLVLHPIQASSILNALHITTARNHRYAAQGRAATNDLADRVKTLFADDSACSYYYNRVLAGGKWNHMMDQTHISYTDWQQPDRDVLPFLKRITLPPSAALGIAIEGDSAWWPQEKRQAVLPIFDSYQQPAYAIDIFNRGGAPFDYTVEPGAKYIRVSEPLGTIDKEKRIWISIDWQHAPKGLHRIPITIKGTEHTTVVVQAIVQKQSLPKGEKAEGFVERQGYISMEAAHFTRAVAGKGVHWQVINNLGRTDAGVITLPVTALASIPGQSDTPYLEYTFHTTQRGAVTVSTYLSPTLNFLNTDGLRYAISLDNEPPQLVNLHANFTQASWEQAVRDNILIRTSTHTLTPGQHALKFWRVDAGVVLQKIVIGNHVPGSYLGPPESFRFPNVTNK
ncbi:glycosyl hydrolase 115 family protein [Parachryseolinea silvisoli]|uniref:glycosyl hydrolase 115 family protein n=1 Tax=Parachryseolinea silvisoli TaxID=2873601 RepID=UPI002265B919|nr:glycosyl hydrolase 115 family protein [Parachryseolinea silvisoli]